MAKKNTSNRKSSGAAAIKTVEDDLDHNETEIHEGNGSESATAATAPKRTPKPKADQRSEGSFGVSEIKKAAAFVNSVGGLDKAMTLLQILKVAKEVQ